MSGEVHKAEALPNLPNFGMPLCWVAEQVEKGVPVVEQGGLWAISLDHETLPGHSVASDPASVTCRPCLELVHA
jgi:hypothetical protein